MTALDVREIAERLELGDAEDDRGDETTGAGTDIMETSVADIVAPEAIRVVVAVDANELLATAELPDPSATLDIAIVDELLDVGTGTSVGAKGEDRELMGTVDEVIGKGDVPTINVEGVIRAMLDPPETLVGNPLVTVLDGNVNELGIVDLRGVDIPSGVDSLITVVRTLVTVEVGPLGM
jgi:hypothetical protein